MIRSEFLEEAGLDLCDGIKSDSASPHCTSTRSCRDFADDCEVRYESEDDGDRNESLYASAVVHGTLPLFSRPVYRHSVPSSVSRSLVHLVSSPFFVVDFSRALSDVFLLCFSTHRFSMRPLSRFPSRSLLPVRAVVASRSRVLLLRSTTS